jgi:hypothetical protein
MRQDQPATLRVGLEGGVHRTLTENLRIALLVFLLHGFLRFPDVVFFFESRTELDGGKSVRYAGIRKPGPLRTSSW